MRTPESGSRPPSPDGDESERPPEGSDRFAEWRTRSLARAREMDKFAAEPPVNTDRFLTVPNMLSLLRLAAVPLFLVLLLVYEADGWALVVLVVSGISDWLDGKLARLLNQVSRYGALLDPIADRLFMVVIPIAFAMRDFIPWWVVLLLVGRDLVLTVMVPVVRSRGVEALPVTYLGKAATFALMYAFPVILAAQGDWALAQIMEPTGIAMLIWGMFLYMWTMVLYLIQVGLVVRHLPKV
ncbi:cardiolipin synthase [Hoyosella altamirensis]|uniref:Cardiolipin synthase n=2 Tax=Hoyosella altamirensis TaxID=616997 RepID=A0A839RJN1_9ACTN|nr:cardiolipin synthase [Hoyosella altamirensis]